VLNQTLGGGFEPLFQKIREQRRPRVLVWSERATYDDTGTLAVVAGTSPQNADEVLDIVTAEFDLLARDGLSEREMAIAKGNCAEALLSGEDSGARMSRLGSSLLLHGEVRSIDDIVAKVETVSPDDVQAAAEELAAADKTSRGRPFDATRFAGAARTAGVPVAKRA